MPVDTNNLVSRLKILNAGHARTLSTSGTAAQRLSALSQAGVATGTAGCDFVPGHKGEGVWGGVV